MPYWRMQLHPDDPGNSVRHAISSISRGLIGLDFRADVGDLRNRPETIEVGQKDYRLFEREMVVGDRVLVQSHHHPLALVEIASDYAYVPDARESLGVWFRHLRLIRNTSYYADYITNPNEWTRIPMTDTIAPLRSEGGIAYQLIQKWVSHLG